MKTREKTKRQTRHYPGTKRTSNDILLLPHLFIHRHRRQTITLIRLQSLFVSFMFNRLDTRDIYRTGTVVDGHRRPLNMPMRRTVARRERARRPRRVTIARARPRAEFVDQRRQLLVRCTESITAACDRRWLSVFEPAATKRFTQVD
jgi:hypothetical protein